MSGTHLIQNLNWLGKTNELMDLFKYGGGEDGDGDNEELTS